MKTTHFYIDGSWVEPVEPRIHPVINPATEEPCAEISLGSARDVEAIRAMTIPVLMSH